MKKCICIILVIAVSILSGCNSSQNEENVFPQNFKEYYEVSPYGNEEEINSLSDVEITLDKKWDFNLENATFFIENMFFIFFFRNNRYIIYLNTE